MKHLILVSFVFWSVSGISQTLPNVYVSEIFSTEEIESMTDSRIDYLNFLSEEGWEIFEVPSEKTSLVDTYPFLYELDRKSKQISTEYLSIEDLSDFNLLRYNFHVTAKEQFFRVANSNYLIRVFSSDEIILRFNQYRTR